MSDEIAKLKEKIIKLNKKISKQGTDIDQYKIKLETARSKLAEKQAQITLQKLKYEQKIASLDSENADLQKRKDGMTAADLMSSLGKIPK